MNDTLFPKELDDETQTLCCSPLSHENSAFLTTLFSLQANQFQKPKFLLGLNKESMDISPMRFSPKTNWQWWSNGQVYMHAPIWDNYPLIF